MELSQSVLEGGSDRPTKRCKKEKMLKKHTQKNTRRFVFVRIWDAKCWQTWWTGLQFSFATQEELDRRSGENCKLVHDGMGKYSQDKQLAAKSKRVYKQRKPCWNKEQQDDRYSLHSSEQSYLKCKWNGDGQPLLRIFRKMSKCIWDTVSISKSRRTSWFWKSKKSSAFSGINR